MKKCVVFVLGLFLFTQGCQPAMKKELKQEFSEEQIRASIKQIANNNKL